MLIFFEHITPGVGKTQIRQVKELDTSHYLRPSVRIILFGLILAIGRFFRLKQGVGEIEQTEA